MDRDTPDEFTPGEAVSAARLARCGLLTAGAGCTVSPLAVFVPSDTQGTIRPVDLGDGCQVRPFAVIFGGTRLGNSTQVEEHAIVGRPEQGYAVGHVYPGAGADTVIGNGAVIRAGAVIYAGTEIGENTVIGHHTLSLHDALPISMLIPAPGRTRWSGTVRSSAPERSSTREPRSARTP